MHSLFSFLTRLELCCFLHLFLELFWCVHLQETFQRLLSFQADRYGRRKLVLVGLFGTCVANIGAVVFTANKVIVALCFAATKAFIGIGCGGPAWFLTSELVDPEYAWIFQPLSTGILLSTTMIETFFYLSIDALIGGYR